MLAQGMAPANGAAGNGGVMTLAQLKQAYPAGTEASTPAATKLQIVKWLAGDQVEVFRGTGATLQARFDQLDTVGGNSGWGSARYLAGRGAKKGAKPSRMDQLVAWLGKDFDGVTAFDEAHNVGNVFPKKGKRGSTQPAAKVRLQALLPNARIVHVSATAATEVSNLFMPAGSACGEKDRRSPS
jgi:hypothetical protein